MLTSLLNEMDGVQELVGVTVIAATNRPDALVGSHPFGFWPSQAPDLSVLQGLGADAAWTIRSNTIRWPS